MFKRKANLPARPPIPSREEIIEDFTRTSPDDVVFKSVEEKTALPSDTRNLNAMPERLDDHVPQDATEHHTPDKAYVMVASFVDKMKHLDNLVTELQSKKRKLRQMEENLRADIDKIEKEFKKRSGPSDEQ